MFAISVSKSSALPTGKFACNTRTAPRPFYINLVVTKADKGGATLIMNFADVKAAIENELFNTEKFSKLERNAESQLEYVRNEVRSLAMSLEQRKLISASDKTLITGLNENNRPKLAPEYQPESPYAYPFSKSTNSHTQKLKTRRFPLTVWCMPQNLDLSIEWGNGAVHISLR